MKKLAFLVMSALILVSCSQDDAVMENASVYETQVVVKDRTLESLERFNDGLAGPVVESRSIWKFAKRVLKTAFADALAAVNGAADGAGVATKLGCNPTWSTACEIGFAVSKAVPASKKAWQESSNYAISISDLQLFTKTKEHCLTAVCTLNDNDTESEDGYVNEDGIFVSYPDSIRNQILLPSSFSHLKEIGKAHNLIFWKTFNSSSNEAVVQSEPISPYNPDPADNGLTEYFNSSQFSTDFYGTISDVALCCDDNGFNYQTYQTLYPFSSQNVQSTMNLFYTAMTNSVDDYSDLLYLVNSYISIIEQNNEFTAAERSQIYSGLVVILYSYELWKSVEEDTTVSDDEDPILFP